jgi:lipoprotein NlpI
LYLARTRSKKDGKAELTVNTQSMDGKKWPAPVVALYLGNISSQTVISQAADPDPKKHTEQMCEANFYLGEWHLLNNEEQQARMLFTRAQNECPKTFVEYTGAVSELQRLK